MRADKIFDELAEKIGWEFAHEMTSNKVWRTYGYVVLFKRYINKYLQELIDYYENTNTEEPKGVLSIRDGVSQGVSPDRKKRRSV